MSGEGIHPYAAAPLFFLRGGYSVNDSLNLAAGFSMGLQAAMRHPEWAQAYLALPGSPAADPSTAEDVDALVSFVRIEVRDAEG